MVGARCGAVCKGARGGEREGRLDIARAGRVAERRLQGAEAFITLPLHAAVTGTYHSAV